MPYDHSTKIGNQGDVVKHVALFTGMKQLLAQRKGEQEFIYADIHAGRPEYILPAQGEWQHGIGRFSSKEELEEDRRQRREGRPTELGVLGEFDETFVGQTVGAGTKYPGSTGISHRLLAQSGLAYQMRLWDEDAEVAEDLHRYFKPWQDQVSVTRGDGYRGIKEGPAPAFALIDPPALESDKVLAVMDHLNLRGVPFLCWTPRTSRSIRPATPDGYWSAAEAAGSMDYILEAGKRGSCLRVRWHRWGSRTPGCCITVSAGLANGVSAVVRQVAALMGWEVEAPG